MPAQLAALDDYLAIWAQGTNQRSQLALVLGAISKVMIEISRLASQGVLAGELGRVTARAGEFDEQKEIDVLSNNLLIEALKKVPVAAFASEELPEAVLFDAAQPYLVAADPLDGSSNVEANISFGTIFSILPSRQAATTDEMFYQPGHRQLAAGFAVYGPQTVLALTVGAGTKIFTLDRDAGIFRLTHATVSIPPLTKEYSINSSNARHWDDPVRLYIHDVENGSDGPRRQDFNMRWTGSPVSDVYRILIRGGIYLYPGDRRKGFQDGRIRLIYEANPLAWIIEDAGGRATTGSKRVLDVAPQALHQRTPLIAGSRLEVDHFLRVATGLDTKGERSPLFGKRGLLRAW